MPFASTCRRWSRVWRGECDLTHALYCLFFGYAALIAGLLAVLRLRSE